MEEINLENKTIVSINKNKIPDERSSGTLISLGSDYFLLIGGASREKVYNDIWSAKITNHKKQEKNVFEIQWKEIKLNDKLNDVLSARFGAVGAVIHDINKQSTISSTSVNYETNCLKLMLHGGQNYFENKHYADMLELNLTFTNLNESFELNEIKNYTNYPLNPQTTPRERNSHGMSKHENKLYIFGGGSSDGLNNDLWSFNYETYKWIKHEYSGSQISPREMHGLVTYTNKNSESFVYVFGGRLYEEIDNKMYRINLSNFTCELVCELPTRLCSFSYSSFKHFLIIYGGTDGVNFLNDIIIFNLITRKWAKSKIQINYELINSDPNLVGFLGRIGSMMSIDSVSENLIIFGGSSLHKDNNFTFAVSLSELLNENNLIQI